MEEKSTNTSGADAHLFIPQEGGEKGFLVTVPSGSKVGLSYLDGTGALNVSEEPNSLSAGIKVIDRKDAAQISGGNTYTINLPKGDGQEMSVANEGGTRLSVGTQGLGNIKSGISPITDNEAIGYVPDSKPSIAPSP